MGKLLIATLSVIAAVACGSSASEPINQLIAPVDVRTGWFDAGVEDGKNKLLPTIVLRLKNVSGDTVANVQLNAVIRRVGETEEWGGSFRKVIDSNGLAAGATTEPIVLRSNLGYTGTEPRAQMLKNSQFVDAQVQVFAKHGGNQWTKVGDWRIARELLTQ